ncbi:MAG: hypothetical protein IPG31_08840 [Nitrosomonas sp.]|nr:hypothetical protein [Nitrosomonas sp.]
MTRDKVAYISSGMTESILSEGVENDRRRTQGRHGGIQAEYENIGITVYAVLKDAETPGPVKLDIEAEALESLKALFMQSLREAISGV